MVLNALRSLYLRTLSLIGLSSRVEITLHPSSPRKLIRIDPKTGEKIRTGLEEVIDRCKSLSEGWYTPTAWLSRIYGVQWPFSYDLVHYRKVRLVRNLCTLSCHILGLGHRSADFSIGLALRCLGSAPSNSDHLLYSRSTIRVPDGGTLCLDFTPPITPTSPLDPTQPILVVCHGLTGGSHESYVRDVLTRVTRTKAEGGLGWRGMVVNSRGCAGAPVTSGKLYNGGVTDDLRSALSFLTTRAPKAPLYGIGFSLGANQLAKYLGQESENAVLKAGIIVAAPWDFVEGHYFLSESWLKLIYSRAMAANLRRILKPHRAMFEKVDAVDWDAIYGNPNQTLFEFDSLFTAPASGFRTGIEYYRWASANQTIQSVAVPMLTFSAADDPIVASATVPTSAAETNPNLIFARTKHGGHLGWFQGFFQPRRWISKPVVEFLRELEKADDGVARGGYRVHGGEGEAELRVGGKMRLVEGREMNVGFEWIGEGMHDEKQEVVQGDGEDGLTKGL